MTHKECLLRGKDLTAERKGNLEYTLNICGTDVKLGDRVRFVIMNTDENTLSQLETRLEGFSILGNDYWLDCSMHCFKASRVVNVEVLPHETK